MKRAVEMVSVALQQKPAPPPAPRDAVVLLMLRKTGSPAGTDAGNITHY